MEQEVIAVRRALGLDDAPANYTLAEALQEAIPVAARIRRAALTPANHYLCIRAAEVFNGYHMTAFCGCRSDLLLDPRVVDDAAARHDFEADARRDFETHLRQKAATA